MSARTIAAESGQRNGLTMVPLVTLALPDLVVRVSTQRINVPWARSPDGEDLPFYAGVLELPEDAGIAAVDRFGGGAIGGGAGRLLIATDVLDFCALTFDGRAPAAAVVEVAWIWPGEDFDRRVVVVRDARVESMTATPATAELALRQGDPGEGALICDPRRTVYTIGYGAFTTTYAVHELDTAKRQVAPEILGLVRGVPAHRARTTVSADYLLIAGHAIPSGQELYLKNDRRNNSSGYQHSPVVTLGYSFIQGDLGTSDPDGGTFAPSAPDDTAHLPGGLTINSVLGRKAPNGQPYRGLGQILEYLLRRSGVAVDWGRCRAALRRAAGFQIGVYCDEPVPALKLIRDRILPVVPLVEQRSGEGIWYAWTATGTGEPIQARLVAGQHWHRDGGIRVDTSGIKNAFTLQYRYHYAFNDYRARVVLDASNSAICAHSASTYGTRHADNVASTVLYLPSSAWAAVRWMAARDALPRVRVEGVLEPSLYWLDAGAIVTLTDTSIGLDGRRAVLASRSVEDPARCVFEVINAPAYIGGA